MLLTVLLVVGVLLGLAVGVGIAALWTVSLRKQAKDAIDAATNAKAAAQNEIARNIVLKDSLESERAELQMTKAAVAELKSRMEGSIVTLENLATENRRIKSLLLHVHLENRRLKADHALLSERQGELDERAVELGKRYLKDTEKWIAAKLGPNNYARCKQDLLDAIERCRVAGCPVSNEEERALLDGLKADFEEAVRVAVEREEQARIKAQIREEQARQREIDRALAQMERERDAVRVALEKALADAQGRHTEEVARLQARLADAEAARARTIAQAQLTKAGHIYVISNIGSFGERVYKIGMTRRLEPRDRIDELSDASVPFPFDVHMMISCDDAPALENALHKHFSRYRINRVNLRKEFFRVDLEEVRKFVEQHHGEVRYTADAEALEYRQSISVTDEDAAYIEGVFEQQQSSTDGGAED